MYYLRNKTFFCKIIDKFTFTPSVYFGFEMSDVGCKCEIRHLKSEIY